MPLVQKITEICSLKFQDFRDEQKFCDVTLLSDPENIEVNAHRMVLSAASDYFLKMFTSQMQESYKKDISIYGVDGVSLKSVVDYIYTNSIALTPDTVENILKAAHLFAIAPLQTICSDFMAKQLDVCNCLETNQFAEQYGVEKLARLSEKFVCENFMEIREKKEFLELSFDQLSKFLSSDYLDTDCEGNVFKSVGLWVRYDVVHREKHLDTLLQNVRFEMLSPKSIANKITTKGSKAPTSEAHKQLLSQKRSEDVVVRRKGKQLFTTFSWDKRKRTFNALLYYPKLDEWICKSMPPPIYERTYYACTYLKEKLIIIAGGSLHDHISEVESSAYCLDLETSRWTPFTALITPRRSFKMTSIGEFIYVVGGLTSGMRWNDTVDRWDPASKQWTTIASLKVVPFKKTSECFHVAASSSLLCISVQEEETKWQHLLFDLSNMQFKVSFTQNSYERLLTTSFVNEELLMTVFEYSTAFYNCKSMEMSHRASIEPPISNEWASVCDDQIIEYGNNYFRIYKYNENMKSWEMHTDKKFKSTENSFETREHPFLVLF